MKLFSFLSNTVKISAERNIYVLLNETLKQLLKLPLLHKLFLLMLILVFIYLVNRKAAVYEYYDDMTSNKKFDSKFEDAIYDAFYANYYDKIYENKERDVEQLKIIVSYAKNKKFVKFLDIGCGTGYHVHLLNKMKYDVIGLDKSKRMITKAQSKYPNCEFIEGDILKNNLFDYNSFTHILCLNKTFYIIKDKDTFFENCALLLSPDGILIIHLLTRENFKPFILPKDDTILYNPENHNIPITKNIIKFTSNLEYVCNYEVLNNENNDTSQATIDNFNQPYSCYHEKFENFETHNIRKNLINLYIPNISEQQVGGGFSFYNNLNLLAIISFWIKKNLINIKVDSKLIGSVYTIYDNTGRAVLTGKLNSKDTTLELNNLSGGIYMLSVGENMKQTFKVIKE
jgi:SAM-dependent methyltransferase